MRRAGRWVTGDMNDQSEEGGGGVQGGPMGDTDIK